MSSQKKQSAFISIRNWFILLIALLVIGKVFSIYHIALAFPLNPPLPQSIDLETMIVVFMVMASAIFVKRGSNDCWFIALNFVGLILISIILEWYLPNLGVAVFLLMISTVAAEEIVFRFALFELLWDRLKPAMIVLITSVIYTLLHADIYHHVVYGLMVLITGLVLGTIYLVFRQKNHTVMGLVIASWVHLAVILLGISLSVIP